MGVVWVCRKELTRWAGVQLAAGMRGAARQIVGARAILAPLYAGLGVLAGALVVVVVAPRLWWVFPAVGVAGATLTAWRVRQFYRRIWITADTAVWGLYGGLAVAGGAAAGYVWGGLALAVAGAVPHWVEAKVSGEARVLRRLQPSRWAEMCEARGLKGLKRGRIARTVMGLDVVVTLNGKLTIEMLNSHVRQLETGLGTRRGAVRITAHEMANKATMRIMTRNPLRKAVVWPAIIGPVSITEPALLSLSPFGEWTEVDLRQRILIVGASGSGKSSVQRVLAARVILADDADLEVWDLKQGTESQHYQGKARRVTTVVEAISRIDELLTVELPRRAAILRQRRTSTWKPSPTDRDLIVMVDEGAALIRELDEQQLARLFTLIEQARAFGIFIWWATQYPKATNLPSELRSQMSCVIALKMRRASESRVVFEDGTREGWTPHRLTGTGWLLISDDDHDEPEPTRAAWIDEKTFRKLTPSRVALDGPTIRPAIEAFEAVLDGEVVEDQNVDEQPAAPAVPVDGAMTTVAAVLLALADAGPTGLSAAGLQLATGRSKTRVYAALAELQDDGGVTKLKAKGGHYALTTAQTG
jgi:S-DNA-T family DNA segregation ATPase FtsK/SpoIIIE